MKKRISILGSTGSIGRQTLQVVAENIDKFEIIALSAQKNFKLLAQQARRFSPGYVVITDVEAAAKADELLQGTGIKVLKGEEGLLDIAADEKIDLLVNSLVGFAGLKPTLAAVDSKTDVALANKESLVAAGAIVMSMAAKNDVKIIPIDSEHNAIFQCMAGSSKEQVHRIILTASGGPFRDMSKAELLTVTPAQALRHPNWDMGDKITVDSATMVNKGLEVLEAHWLFGLELDRIDVVVHPQSIVHSLVEFIDGSVLAQLGEPDMKTPIQYALSYPERWQNNDLSGKFKLTGKNLTFIEPDYELFPGLELAYRAGRLGGIIPAIMNAANEVAVNNFLQEKIKYPQIAELIESVIAKGKQIEEPTIKEIFAADIWAREKTTEIIIKRNQGKYC